MYGAVGWSGFSARPDLLLYSFIVPISIAVSGSDFRTKRDGLLVLGLTAVAVGVQIFFAWRYFNSPLPLSFYAKGARLYGEFLVAQYRFIPVVEFLSYAASYWYLGVLIGADLIFNFKEWKARVSALEKGFLAATGLFVLYYLFFVLQIMPYHQRFYYPTLPAILFLAAQSAVRLSAKLPQSARRELRISSRAARLLTTLFLLGFLFPAALSVSRAIGSQLYKGQFLHFDILDDYRRRGYTYWFRLDAFSALPDDLVMATTEVGIPAAMNPQKTIVDLSGLNETNFVRNGFSADYLFQNYQPDLIYMPHPHYQRTIEQISGHPHFVQSYEYFPASVLGVKMGVALKRDSRYHSEMRAIVKGRLNDQ